MENSKDLKLLLIEQIFHCNDLEKLQKIQSFFQSNESNSVRDDSSNYEVAKAKVPAYFSEETTVLSDAHLEMIRIAEEDIKAGRTISNEELKKADERWMNWQ